MSVLATIAAATLMIHTYEGQTNVVPHLGVFECEVARCFALSGKTCSRMIGDGLANDRYAKIEAEREAVWRKTHSCTYKNGVTYCPLNQYEVIGSPSGGVSTSSSSATRAAMCVREEQK